MWCKQCRQDVPALFSGDKQAVCCPRCGDSLDAKPTEASEGSAAYDSWEMDEQLRHIGRVLRPDTADNDKSTEIYRREASLFDIPHAGPPAWHVSGARQTKKTRKTEPKRQTTSGAFVGIALYLGALCLVCGVVLLGWSLADGRQELWNIGLPVAFGGQIALLVGLVLQLDRLWRDNRDAAAKLDSVDEQLHDLKTTTTLLGTSQGPAASVFYSHFAGGAGPQLLLTDLKSQIDLLAMKIAQDDR